MSANTFNGNSIKREKSSNAAAVRHQYNRIVSEMDAVLGRDDNEGKETENKKIGLAPEEAY